MGCRRLGSAQGSQTRRVVLIFPARVAARLARSDRVGGQGRGLGARDRRIVDSALAGPLPEEIARSLVRHRVIERVVAELAATASWSA